MLTRFRPLPIHAVRLDPVRSEGSIRALVNDHLAEITLSALGVEHFGQTGSMADL